jgi:hypothetical protein
MKMRLGNFTLNATFLMCEIIGLRYFAPKDTCKFYLTEKDDDDS